MRKVILVRHGKSSWDDPELDDHDRPLAPRGRRASPVIARWLEARGHAADRVLCSSAVRARETHAAMAQAVAMPEATVEPDLYHAAPGQMLERLRAIGPQAASVMVIGHNPGLAALARRLARPKVRAGCARAFRHFPTAAAAVFTFDTEDWGALGWGTGTFVDFAVPRELEQKA